MINLEIVITISNINTITFFINKERYAFFVNPFTDKDRYYFTNIERMFSYFLQTYQQNLGNNCKILYKKEVLITERIFDLLYSNDMHTQTVGLILLINKYKLNFIYDERWNKKM